MTEREAAERHDTPWRVVVVKVKAGDTAHLAALGLGKMPLAKGLSSTEPEGYTYG